MTALYFGHTETKANADLDALLSRMVMVEAEVALAIPAPLASSVVFSGNVITETYNTGVVVTTTFNGDGTISTVYGAPVSKTVTTTFNSDGSISEVIT